MSSGVRIRSTTDEVHLDEVREVAEREEVAQLRPGRWAPRPGGARRARRRSGPRPSRRGARAARPWAGAAMKSGQVAAHCDRPRRTAFTARAGVGLQLVVDEDARRAVDAVLGHLVGGVGDPLLEGLVLDRRADGVLVGAGLDRPRDQLVVVGPGGALGGLVLVEQVVVLREGVGPGGVGHDVQRVGRPGGVLVRPRPGRGRRRCGTRPSPCRRRSPSRPAAPTAASNCWQTGHCGSS